MAYRDLYSNVQERTALLPASYAASVDGVAVDLFGVRAVAVMVHIGAITGAALFGVKLQHSDDGVAWADAPPEQVQTNAPAVLLQNSARRLGYIGGKRYIRPVFTKGTGTSAFLSSIAVIEPLQRPAA